MKTRPPLHQVKFYADMPDGQRNKLCTYPVHDYSHAIDILVRFKRKGATIRKAYFNSSHTYNGQPLNVPITPKAYEDELLHETYSEKKRYQHGK
jgi:hypothetical protein